MALSLSAQVVEAEQSVVGWIAAAIPALGFLVMVKVALGHTPDSPAVEVVPEGRSGGVPATPEAAVAFDPMGGAGSERAAGTAIEAVPGGHEESSGRSSTNLGDGVPSTPDEVILAFLPAARLIADEYEAQRRRLSRTALADALRAQGKGISNARASRHHKAVQSERGKVVSMSRSRAAARPTTQ